jgi:hypothetical protein
VKQQSNLITKVIGAIKSPLPNPIGKELFYKTKSMKSIPQKGEVNNMENQVNQLTVMDNEKEKVAIFSPQTTALFCSINNDGSAESKAKIYNAINDTDFTLRDCMGQVINVVDIVAHPITLLDDEGHEQDAMRVVLVDDAGHTYHTVANGIMSSLQKVFAIYGQPTYEPPVKMIPVEKKTRKGFRTLTLRLQA